MEINSQEKKPKAKTKITTVPVRVKVETRKRILSELAKINKKDFGRKAKVEDYLSLAISLIGPEHFKKLQEATLSNQDRLEREYRTYIAKHGAISKDDYLGKRLRGEIPSILAGDTNDEKISQS